LEYKIIQIIDYENFIGCNILGQQSEQSNYDILLLFKAVIYDVGVYTAVSHCSRNVQASEIGIDFFLFFLENIFKP
jgi:hypothetical protein